MITCDEALELLSATLDGPTTAKEQDALSAHLSQCAECRALQADFSAIHAGMKDWKILPPPSNLTDRIMTEVRASKTIPIPRPKRWRGWAGIAAVCTIALLGVGPLRMWLSPDGLMGGMATDAGATPASQVERFEAMPAPLQENDGQMAVEAVMDAASAPSLSIPEHTNPITEAPSAPTHFYKSANTPVPSAFEVTERLEITAAQGAETQGTPPPQVSTDANTEGGMLTGAAVKASSPPLLTAPRMATIPTYCGSLTLPYEDAPDLSDYTYIKMGTEWYYTLPAQAFFDLAEGYQGLATAVHNTEDLSYSSDASEGIVILTGVPEETP